MIEQIAHVRRELVGVAVGYEEARVAVVDQAEQTTDPTGHHRDATGRRLECHQAEALAAAGHQHHIGGAVVGGQDVVRLRRHETHLVAQTQLVDERHHAVELGIALGSAGTADDQQDGIAATQRGERAHRHVGTLQRLDAANEQQHRHVVG